MYKAFFACVLLCILALFAAGCGSDEADKSSGDATTTEQVPPVTKEEGKAAVEQTKADQPAPKQMKTSPKPPELSAQKLYDLYQKDPDGADKLYKGKVLRVSGIIWKVDTKEDGRGIPYLTLKTSSMFGSVICFFDRDQIPALNKLKKGSKITLSGTCNGQKVGVQNVDMMDCSL